MAVLNKTEFMNLIKSRVGDDSSDEALKFIEDINDTFNDLESKIKPNKKSDEEWQKELDNKEQEWRERYKARFFESDGTDDEKDDDMLAPTEDKPKPEETVTFNDLFNESEEK